MGAIRKRECIVNRENIPDEASFFGDIMKFPEKLQISVPFFLVVIEGLSQNPENCDTKGKVISEKKETQRYISNFKITFSKC